MTSSWSGLRPGAIEAARMLSEALEDDEIDSATLLRMYASSKRELAQAFQALAAETLVDDRPFAMLVARLDSAAEAMFPSVPAKYRTVTGFGTSHRRLFGYLASRHNEDVPIEELRLLTADAVHTERRLRELRDLGLNLLMLDVGGRRVCRVVGDVDVSTAAQVWTLKKIDSDKSLRTDERAALVASMRLS